MPGISRRQKAKIVRIESIGPVESANKTLVVMIGVIEKAIEDDERSNTYATVYNTLGSILSAGVGGGVRNFM